MLNANELSPVSLGPRRFGNFAIHRGRTFADPESSRKTKAKSGVEVAGAREKAGQTAKTQLEISPTSNTKKDAKLQKSERNTGSAEDAENSEESYKEGDTTLEKMDVPDHSPECHLPEQPIPRIFYSPNSQSPNLLFPEQSIPRIFYSPNSHSPESN